MTRRSRSLVVLVALVIACAPVPSAIVPTPTPSGAASSAASPTATPRPAPIRARSVTPIGGGFAASGDFRGTGGAQVALLQDPSADLTVRISVRDQSSDQPTDAVWFKSDPSFLSVARMKLAVADVDFDGKDDLVALYDSGTDISRLFVFKSTGTSFVYANAWWTGEGVAWARARNILSGRFSVADTHDSLLITYQDDDARMRLLPLISNGTVFNLAADVYNSGAGQLDLSRARFATGHFTRSGGPDQIAMLYQSTAHAKLSIFEPGTTGFTLQRDLFETDVDYDLRRAALAAADVTSDGRDDLLALYTADDGSAKAQVLDSGASFKPSNGWNGWAALPAGSTCAFAGALVVGDWNAAGRVDPIVLEPGAASAVAELVLRNSGSGFTQTGSKIDLHCPVWPLTGLPLANGDATRRPVYVKTDNNPTARPHYGISKADMVYEWLVEGLTTRLAAVYQSQQPDVIGSVRSVRMTDRHVLPSLDAVLVYSGGGPEELMAINYDASVAKRYIDLSPNYGWGYRVPFRPAPYNYFTTWAAVQSAIAAAPDADQPAQVAAWRFLPTADGDPMAGGFGSSVPATDITIPYRALFGVSYRYDPATRTYARFDDGVREVDAANNVTIAARNIVVIQTEVHFTTAFGLDPAGNPKLEEVLTGTGKGEVFRDGRRVDVTWSRDDVVSSFILRDASGAMIELSPGQTWIHVVPNDWTIPSS